jgi:hypothetical protein
VNVDNPSEFEILASSGTGVDPQDKGVGKAMTYSYKYLLLRTFAIPTGEDPDKVHNGELEKQQTKVAPQKEEISTSPIKGDATTGQKKQIYDLLENPSITKDEKVKMLINVPKMTEERALEAIEKLKSAIIEREKKATS